MEKMSIGEHLLELRYRLILSLTGIAAGLTISLFLGDYIINFISEPYRQAILSSGLKPLMQAIEPAESFLVYLKTSLLSGLILSSPFVFYQIWAFISAGLYPVEKRYVYLLTPLSALLFISGSLFFIMIIAPIVINFFINFNPGIDFIKSEFSFQSYISFIVSMTVIFGLSFQFPIIIIVLSFIGIISLEDLKKSRKFVILFLVIVAAAVTPPDVISQLALALPLYALYEISIVFCWLLNNKKSYGKKMLI